MNRRLRVTIIIVILILIVMTLLHNSHNKKELTEIECFKQLIQYKTDSINDVKNLEKILNKTELGSYIVKTEKSVYNGKEQLNIYYDCIDENAVREYWINANKKYIMEKNSVILFSLINNLEKIVYRFSVSDEKLKNLSHISKDIIMEYDRETINLQYNQDVRNYVSNPSEFLKYNIDLNTNKITIYKVKYTMENKEYDKFEIKPEEIRKIKEFIENENFGINVEQIEGMIDILIDFHNGYSIGVYANSDIGIIIKENAEDIINNNNNSNEIVYKTLPRGLMEYINLLVKKSK